MSRGRDYMNSSLINESSYPVYDNPTYLRNGKEIPILGINDKSGAKLYYKNGVNEAVLVSYEKYQSTRFWLLLTEIVLFVIATIAQLSCMNMFRIHWVPVIFLSKINASISLIVVGVVLVALWIAFVKFSYQYTKVGEEQLDIMIPNAVGLLIMIIVWISLTVQWITTAGRDHPGAGEKLRQTIMSYIDIQSLILMIVVASSINRHTASKRTLVNHQLWLRGNDFDKEQKNSVMYKHFIEAPSGRWAIIIFAVVFEVVYTILTAVYVNSRFGGDYWHFTSFYKTFTASVGILAIFLCISYFVWNVIARHFDSIYRLHYNYFFYATLIPTVIIIFCLASFRHNYRDVSDENRMYNIKHEDFDRLKVNYLDSIALFMLVSYSIMGSGFCKLWCLFNNLAPNKVNGVVEPAHEALYTSPDEGFTAD